MRSVLGERYLPLPERYKKIPALLCVSMQSDVDVSDFVKRELEICPAQILELG